MTAQYGVGSTIPLASFTQRMRSVTPAALAAGRTDNYAPADAVTQLAFYDAQIIRQATHSSGSTLSGLDSTHVADGQHIVIENLGPGVLTLEYEAHSTEANRFLLSGSVDLPLPVGFSALFVRDDATARHRFVSSGSAIVTAGSITASMLAATAVTPGSYTAANITVDQQGRITAAASGSAAVFTWPVGTAWATVYAAMSAVSGPKICLVEIDKYPTYTGRVMTAGAYDINNILFMGIGGEGHDDTCARITVADGVTFTDTQEQYGKIVRLSSKDLSWDFSALTAPAYTAADATNDYAYLSFDNGRIAGTAALGVVNGTMYLTLKSVYADGVLCVATLSGYSVLRATNWSQFGAVFADNGDHNSVSVETDATCEWSLGNFESLGITATPNVHNYAYGDDHKIYSISVVGGVVTATLVG